MINSPDEMIIKMVEIAAMVGSIWSRKAKNMLLVMVELSPPATNREIMISSKEVKNAIKDAEIMENLICGRVISRNARNRPAPKDRATFSWFIS